MTLWLEFGVALVLVVVFMYLTPPGRRVRHRMVYWQLRKSWQSGRAVVNLRLVDGTQEGLPGRRWFGGTAIVHPGRIEFTMWVGGFPLVKKPVPAMEVTAVGTPGPAKGVDKIKLMDPDYQVALIRTPTATLEIAVPPPIPAEQVLTRLRTPDMPPV